MAPRLIVLSALPILLAASPPAKSSAPSQPSQAAASTMLGRLKAALGSANKSQASLAAVAPTFRFSPRITNGISSVGEWWLGVNHLAELSAAPDPVDSAAFHWQGQSDAWLALHMRLETGWQLYIECNAAVMTGDLYRRAETTSSPTPDEVKVGGVPPTVYFVTPKADGTRPDFVATITLWSQDTKDPRTLPEFYIRYCDVLPFSLQ